MSSQEEKIMQEVIKKLPIEEKIKLLSEEDKRYLAGFIDHALQCDKPQTNE